MLLSFHLISRQGAVGSTSVMENSNSELFGGALERLIDLSAATGDFCGFLENLNKFKLEKQNNSADTGV